MDTKVLLIGFALSAIAFIGFRCYVHFVEKDIRKLEQKNERLERDNKILSAAWLENEETIRVMTEMTAAMEERSYGVQRTTPIKKEKLNGTEDKGYFNEF